jgi:hypothetical protein
MLVAEALLLPVRLPWSEPGSPCCCFGSWRPVFSCSLDVRSPEAPRRFRSTAPSRRQPWADAAGCRAHPRTAAGVPPQPFLDAAPREERDRRFPRPADPGSADRGGSSRLPVLTGGLRTHGEDRHRVAAGGPRNPTGPGPHGDARPARGYRAESQSVRALLGDGTWCDGCGAQRSFSLSEFEPTPIQAEDPGSPASSVADPLDHTGLLHCSVDPGPPGRDFSNQTARARPVAILSERCPAPVARKPALGKRLRVVERQITRWIP